MVATTLELVLIDDGSTEDDVCFPDRLHPQLQFTAAFARERASVPHVRGPEDPLSCSLQELREVVGTSRCLNRRGFVEAVLSPASVEYGNPPTRSVPIPNEPSLG